MDPFIFPDGRIVYASWQRALLDRGKVTPQSYAECLFAVCRKAISERQRLGAVAPSVPFMEVGLTRAGMRNREVLLQRMTAIVTTGGAGTRKGRLFWPVLLAATLMVAISAVAIQRHGDWSHDRLMLSTVVNLERMELRASSGLSLDGYCLPRMQGRRRSLPIPRMRLAVAWP